MPAGLHRTYGALPLHFITCSCHRRLPNLRTERARDRFVSILEETRRRYRFVVVGYVVMPEHFHLLISEPEVVKTAYRPCALAEKETSRPTTVLVVRTS